VNKVRIVKDDYGVVSVTLNRLRLEGVQSIGYRDSRDGRSTVTIELLAELYQTDDEDLFEAEHDIRARYEKQLAKERAANEELQRQLHDRVEPFLRPTNWWESPYRATSTEAKTVVIGDDFAARREVLDSLHFFGAGSASAAATASDSVQSTPTGAAADEQPTPPRPGFYTEHYPEDGALTISGPEGVDE
jgi:hypothetical protein